MDYSINVTGAKELEAALGGFERKVSQKVVGKALRTGANIIKDKQRSNAPAMVGGDMGGQLAKAIKVKAGKPRRYSHLFRVWIDPKTEGLVVTSKDGTRNYIPAAIEYGHAAPDDAKGTKVVAAIPFMRDGYDSKKNLSKRAVEIALKLGIERVASSGVKYNAR